MDHCSNEGRISSIETKLNNIDKTVNGNGQKGVRDMVTELCINYKSLDMNVQGIARSVSALVKFQTEIETKEDVINYLEQKADKHRKRNQWLIGITITLVLGILGIIVKNNIF